MADKAKVSKIVIVHSKGIYTTYSQSGEQIVEILYSGNIHKAEEIGLASAVKYQVNLQLLDYPVIGRRRTLEDAVKSFESERYVKIRKDLLQRALLLLNRPQNTLSVIYHGPFAYIRENTL